MLFAWITDPNAWLALGTLTLLEIVLGIDNIIFLSLVVAKLPTAQRAPCAPDRFDGRDGHASGAAGLNRLGR
ncbi:integral membrane protein TerC [Klebsiella pneumoniae]|uniref:Integral membrane protein TerC n=1 Tax=Klebsiella pneumoniae TaxID=573 RepID=A0A2X3ESC6_KLEPN|nr:integral membrane protein TerC [Klebsiella pneumoniae]